MEMQIKLTIRCHLKPITIATLKKRKQLQKITCVGKDVEKLKQVQCEWEQNGVVPVGNRFLEKLKRELPCDTRSVLLKAESQRDIYTPCSQQHCSL